MSDAEYMALFSASIPAKWHSIFVDVISNRRGLWLQLTETRPGKGRASILLEAERLDDFERELLKAVSVIRAAQTSAHSAIAVRARSCAEWSAKEDDVLRFLFQSGSGIAAMANALQRERSAIRSRLKHLEIEVAEA